MPSKAKKGRQFCNKHAFNSREWVMISRTKNGDCTFCPPNGGENLRGSHSKWGKKKATKHAYSTGKGRKQWFEVFYKRRVTRWKYRPQFYDKNLEEN